MTSVTLLIGTRKGAFLATSDNRQNWRIEGPFCAAWPINRVVHDPATDTIYAGRGNEWFGPAVWKSTDRGATCNHSSIGLGLTSRSCPVAETSPPRGRSS